MRKPRNQPDPVQAGALTLSAGTAGSGPACPATGSPRRPCEVFLPPDRLTGQHHFSTLSEAALGMGLSHLWCRVHQLPRLEEEAGQIQDPGGTLAGRGWGFSRKQQVAFARGRPRGVSSRGWAGARSLSHTSPRWSAALPYALHPGQPPPAARGQLPRGALRPPGGSRRPLPVRGPHTAPSSWVHISPPLPSRGPQGTHPLQELCSSQRHRRPVAGKRHRKPRMSIYQGQEPAWGMSTASLTTVQDMQAGHS